MSTCTICSSSWTPAVLRSWPHESSRRFDDTAFSYLRGVKLTGVDLPRAPGDPLAQPARARLFALLAELRRPAGTEELARRLDLHPNGVRVHLEAFGGRGSCAA